jgi:hypothetical protein
MENKTLLVEYRSFQVSKEQLDESVKTNNGELIVQGILTKRDESKNQNGRIYPKEVLEREVDKYKNEFIHTNRALGELDHPESQVINLKNVSHNIVDCWWDGDSLIGKVKILTTPAGNILKELFKCGVAVGISSRALGSVRKIDENTVEVQDDLSLVCFDFVSNPSCIGAFMTPTSPLTESVKPQDVNKYKNVDALIRNILMDVK